MPAILFVTVITSVGIGIFAAYVAVISILFTLGPSQPREAARPHLVLIPTQTHASGD
jgi:hypothetical protein